MSKSNKNRRMPKIKFLLRAILLLSCYLILEAEGGHNFKFVKQSVKQSSWLVDNIMKNTMSESHCAILCVAGHKCSAFVFENGDCMMGSSSTTKPAVDGPSIEIFAKPMSFKIMVLGGIATSLFKLVEIVDMETSETKCAPFPSFTIATQALRGFLGVNKEPVFCGGQQLIAGFVSSCFSYSMTTRTWKSYPSLNMARSWMGFSCNPFTDSLFCISFGGYPFGKTAEYFNGTKWINVNSQMSTMTADLCSVFFNETTILATGGSWGLTVYPSTFFFNINTQAFSTGPPLSNVRKGHSCGRIYKGKDSSDYTVIMAGGALTDQLDPTDIVEVFDYQQNTWKLGNPLPEKICYAAMVEDPMGGVILLGGRSSTATNLQTIYSLANADPGTKWKLMTQKLATGRYDFAAFIVPDIYTNCSLP